MYENIDMEKTGILLKELFDRYGYTVNSENIAFIMPTAYISMV